MAGSGSTVAISGSIWCAMLHRARSAAVSWVAASRSSAIIVSFCSHMSSRWRIIPPLHAVGGICDTSGSSRPKSAAAASSFSLEP